MKIIDDEERNAHWNHVLKEGLKGCAVGMGLAALLVAGVKKRYPQQYMRYNASVKAAMWAMPTISVGAFFADEGSVKFDEQMYRGDFIEKAKKEKQAQWEQLSGTDKVLTFANDHKYKIIIGSWAASLWGSWHIVNRDKYMTTAQKAVQARVYAQAITVVLLLGTIFLSMHEKKLEESRPPPVPEWKRFLEEQQLKQQQQQQNKSTSQ
ncbi:hypothetical protein PUMCH_004391 [Australozyma saopauloensis]|uniref:HIG1 domain-containing protein n=1 Tax=Australozyma saopauloensis TaxID=291208 RepID=A0AAX4HEN4_9ASCO|nr:hypothetical protein PUMCH_004391 [[Candida] saopauloensis]